VLELDPSRQKSILHPVTSSVGLALISKVISGSGVRYLQIYDSNRGMNRWKWTGCTWMVRMKDILGKE
jgi:hypothetical protein